METFKIEENWIRIFEEDKWFYLHDDPEKTSEGEALGSAGVPIVELDGKPKGSNGVTNPIIESTDSELKKAHAERKVRLWMKDTVYLFDFGYKRCALADANFPKGIIIQDKDEIRIVRWIDYALHGLRALGLGKKTSGLTRKPAKDLKMLIANPTNNTIKKEFVEVGGLIEKILSCAISEPLEEKS